jgi:hypothetical protein
MADGIGVRRRSVKPAALAVLLAACGEPASTLELGLSTHGLLACAPPPGARLRLNALGDFPAAETTSEDLPLALGRDLVVPAETLAFEAATDGGRRRFVGYADRGQRERAALLLWPEAESCALSEPRAYPVSGGGQALGFDASTNTALLAGGNNPEEPSASVGVLTFDSGTGRSSRDDELAPSLSRPRAFASVTPFGRRLLVAGGEDPIHEEELAAPQKTAEVYDPARAAFGASIELVVERTRHAAVVLASGATLLVGGRGVVGDALRVLEVVSPERQSASIAGLTALRAPRIAPSALLLDDGRLFVGGGTAADGTPLSALEWLSGDARTHLGAVFPPDLPARYDRAFAALPGGGVLMAGGCDSREP